MEQIKRNCVAVIANMIELIPEDKTDFISDLKWNMEDAFYKAPEENIQWIRTMNTLYKHIPIPKEDWEFNLLSIFTTKSVDELKQSMS